MKKNIVCLVVVAMAVGASAETISLNFVGGGGTLGASDQAGLIGNEAGNSLGSTMAANWNNLTGKDRYGVGGIMHSGGAVVDGVSVSWSAAGLYQLSDTTSGTNTSANTTMMHGYLDNPNAENSSVSVYGLAALSGTYSVIVFTDGNNLDNWTGGTFSSGGTSVYVEDSEFVNFNSGTGNNANGLFQIPVAGGGINVDWPVVPNNREGNMIIFSGLTGSTFTLSVHPDHDRAVINGIQVVGVIPEPATLGLMGLVAGGIMFIRRTFLI